MKFFASGALLGAGVVLSSCGGGGGGGGTDLILTPATLDTTLYVGDSRLIGQYFEAPGVGAGTAYVLVSDPGDVLQGTPEIYREANELFLARMTFSPELSVGHHTGTLKIRVCRDADCGNVVSRGDLPYDIEILSHTNQTTLAPLAGASPWTNSQGGATHLGYVPVTLDPASFSARWKRSLPAFVTGMPAPRVSVADDRVFAAYGTTVYAFNESTGALAWSAQHEGIEASPPAYADGVLHVINAQGFEASKLQGFDAATGQAEYTVSFPYGTYHSTNGWYDWPVIDAGKVLDFSGDSGAQKGAFAFQAIDGAFLWNQGNVTSKGSPAIVGGQAFYYGQVANAITDPALIVLDMDDGAVADTIANAVYSSCGICAAPPAIDGGQAIVNTGQQVIAFDLAGSQEQWAVSGTLRAYPDNGVAVTPTTVFAAQNGSPLQLLALDRSDGSLLWSWSPEPFGAVIAPPGATSADQAFTSSVVATDNLVFVSTERAVYAVSIATHETVWAYPYPGRLAISDNGILYVARTQLYETVPSTFQVQSDGYLAAINLH